ncbi:hypothetical protein HDU90_002233 [Geranomyces variabilis]|nr:hypothetical protein HDU90_002233 [Geranomyces variabilis]
MDAVFHKVEERRAARQHPDPLPRGLNPRRSEYVESYFADDQVDDDSSDAGESESQSGAELQHDYDTDDGSTGEDL